MNSRIARHLISMLAMAGFLSCEGQLSPLDDDAHGSAIAAGQVLRGHVASAGSPKRFSTFRYDLAGRPVAVQHILEGTTYSYSYQYGYTGGNRVGHELGNAQTRITTPDNEHVVSNYDAVGTVQEVVAWLPSTELQNRPSRVVYKDKIAGRSKLNRFGQVEWTEAGDNTRTLRIYDAVRRPLQVLTQKLATGEILQAFGYSYDKVGRVTQVRDYCAQTNSGVVCCDPRDASCSEGPLSTTYEYDVAGWLKKMTSPQATQEFVADAIGNLVRKHQALQQYGENGMPHALTSVVDAKGQRVARYVYNRVGSMDLMEEDGVATKFVWNADNMPTRTEKNGNVTERFYLGESLYKRVDTLNGKTSTTLFLPMLRIEDGTYRKFYGATAERESIPAASGDVSKRRGTLRFYHGDHLGSSTLVTDEQGNPVSRAAYFPFGEHRFSEGTFTPKKQFTSKEKEEVSGLYDYSARLYNPRTGRFISADSVMDGLNPFSYVHNNPINLVDPSGHVASDPILNVGHLETMNVVATLSNPSKRKSAWERFKGIVKNVVNGVKLAFSQQSNEDMVAASLATSLYNDESYINSYASQQASLNERYNSLSPAGKAAFFLAPFAQAAGSAAVTSKIDSLTRRNLTYGITVNSTMRTTPPRGGPLDFIAGNDRYSSMLNTVADLDYHHVAAHGARLDANSSVILIPSGGRMLQLSGPDGGRAFAKMIEKRLGGKPKDPVFLSICHAIDSGVPQQLSNRWGQKVIASKTVVNAGSDGWGAEKPYDRPFVVAGDFHKFSPRGSMEAMPVDPEGYWHPITQTQVVFYQSILHIGAQLGVKY